MSLALPFATGDSYLMSAIPVWDTMLLPLYYVVATVMLGGLAAMTIAGATKADDAVKLSATVAFIGAVVCAVVSVIYAVAISGMGANYTEMQYYFDPTLPDVAMRQSEQITGAILAGEHAVAFWLGNVAIRLRGACRAGGPGDDGQDSRREGPGCGGGCPGVRRDRHHRVARAALRSGRERPHPVPVGALAVC